VIPAYNEAEGLDALQAALDEFRRSLPYTNVRVVVVDDHSDDQTPMLLKRACERHDWLSYIRLSRRSGSHTAVIAGLAQCDEDCAAFISADLQDPPSLLPEMIAQFRQGKDVVWAVRDGDDGQGLFEGFTSTVFHSLMRRISNVGELPYQCSFALMSKRAYRNLVQQAGLFPSLLVDIPRLGYSVGVVPFAKPARKFGTSKWNISRRLRLLFDSVVSASYVPLRFMIYVGGLVSLLGFAYALFLLIRALSNGPTEIAQGWTSLMVVVLVLGGLQMLMLGVIGEYLWRTKEGTRRDALFLIEDEANLRSIEDH
jgi:dolichol-phosphate mannosyltransferase